MTTNNTRATMVMLAAMAMGSSILDAPVRPRQRGGGYPATIPREERRRRKEAKRRAKESRRRNRK